MSASQFHMLSVILHMPLLAISFVFEVARFLCFVLLLTSFSFFFVKGAMGIPAFTFGFLQRFFERSGIRAALEGLLFTCICTGGSYSDTRVGLKTITIVDCPALQLMKNIFE